MNHAVLKERINMMLRLFFFLAVSLSAQTTFSEFAVDVKSHSTARIGWTMSAPMTTDFNLEWDTQATPPFANATSFRTDRNGPIWNAAYITAGKPTYAPYGHSCLSGYKLLVAGATDGWASLNGTRTCTYLDANHFSVDADTKGASSGSIGTAQFLRYEVSVAGFPADTTIYYRACENGGWNCSAVQTFVTDAAPADPYPSPTAPTASGALTSVPTSFARTEATVTNCSNLQAAINAALGCNEAGNVLLPIQKGLRCILTSMPLTIGKNTNTGYLVIRPDSADSELPPNGVRISTNWEASMVTISGDYWGDLYYLANLQLSYSKRIYLMGIIFENEFPTAAIKAITGATAATPIVYTAANHGYSNDDIVQIRDVRGVAGANVTNCKVQNKTDNTFECKGLSGTGSYTSGGYAVKTPPIARQHLSGSSVANVVVDRCIFRYVWPASGNGGAIIQFASTEGHTSDRSTDINFINNLVYNINDWVPVDPDTGARAMCCSNTPYESMVIITGDRILVPNNKIDVPGISFFDNGNRDTDLTFRRNLNTWDTAWRFSDATTNWVTTVRQQFEMKSCFRCLLDGNQWQNQWRGGFGQGTGGYNTPILFSGRSGNDCFTGEYGFSDITITNNLIANAAGGINIGNAGGAQCDQKPIRNVLISNNLMYGINWGQMDAGVYGTTQFGAPVFLVLGGPFENLRIENNTLWDNRRWNSHYSPWNAALSFLGTARGAYFRFHNNFLADNQDGVYNALVWPGVGAEMKPTPVTSGIGIIGSKFLHDIDVHGNIIVPGVTDSSLDANYTDQTKNYSQASCAAYWDALSGVTCHGAGEPNAYTRFATVGFADYANHDFSLVRSSPYRSAGVGVNQDALDAALGKVKSVSVSGISSSGATINYTAPDTDGCTVEAGTSSTWGTGTRLCDEGGDRARRVILGSLSSGTVYNYRILCAAEQPSGSFRTAKATSR
jgi:hypothetical protein